MFSLGNSDCVSPLGYGSGDVLFFFFGSRSFVSDSL